MWFIYNRPFRWFNTDDYTHICIVLTQKKNDGRRTAVSSGIAHAIPFAHTRYNTTYIYLYKNDVHNADDDDGGGW